MSLFSFIRKNLAISVPDPYREEFDIWIKGINVVRAKITALSFVVIETLVIISAVIVKGTDIFKKPDFYYTVMYAVFLLGMVVFFMIFRWLSHDIPGHLTVIQISGLAFTYFTLYWCAGISLLDQFSSGQVIVYVIAVLSIAVAPFFTPARFLLMFLSTHVLFLFLLPHFQKSSALLFSNSINSSTFVMISWAIASMRYKNQVEGFKNIRIIREQNEELNRINKELEKLSQTDSLTGIANRFVFDRTIAAEWDRCKRHFSPLTLMMIDIDSLKSYNDRFGHLAGDDCIRKVACVLSACAKRSSDTVTRYGGDEFAIILPYLGKEDALELAHQMREMVDSLEFVTISIGIGTIVPSGESTLEAFIKATDGALYEAKKSRNKIMIA